MPIENADATHPKFAMTAAEISHVRHEISAANYTVKVLCSIGTRDEVSTTNHSLLKLTKEKLDEVLAYIDSRCGGKNSKTEVNNSTPAYEREENGEAVLVDDDQLIQSSWRLRAKQKGKKLTVYSSAEELLANIDKLNPKTPVYIDFRLQYEQMRGNVLAEELYHRGFRELYLSTGLNRDELPVMDIIKEIRGKNPPW